MPYFAIRNVHIVNHLSYCLEKRLSVFIIEKAQKSN